MTGEDRESEPVLDARAWEGDPGGVTPPPDELFRVLSNAARRRILGYLLETTQTTIEEVVDVLVGWAASETGLVGPEDREVIEAGLYHVHLPALSDAGLVAYDAAAGDVELRTIAGRTRDVIRLANRYDRLDRAGESTSEPDPRNGTHGGA